MKAESDGPLVQKQGTTSNSVGTWLDVRSKAKLWMWIEHCRNNANSYATT